MDIKKELTLTVQEIRRMINFYKKLHQRDPKIVGKIIIGIILLLAFLQSMR